MTEDQKKEAISREILRILAHSHGFKASLPEYDHGVDMTVCHVARRTESTGKARYCDSSLRLDFQLKATTTTGIVDAGNDIKFDPEVKNYNDLVARRDNYIPLYLIVVVLCASPPDCVSFDAQQLCLACRAYWYLPPEDAQFSNNEQRIRITIPKTNQLGIGFMRERFKELLGVEL